MKKIIHEDAATPETPYRERPPVREIDSKGRPFSELSHGCHRSPPDRLSLVLVQNSSER